ncbi:hypothetical protein V500_05048 [Pseudogymnoascus sp. VKM F-4518 (FW-2643)]|nr:hypothetical protein V500_05048 [Pseudogymnoascus sp. VKM F-4518 (FW-2643)]
MPLKSLTDRWAQQSAHGTILTVVTTLVAAIAVSISIGWKLPLVIASTIPGLLAAASSASASSRSPWAARRRPTSYPPATPAKPPQPSAPSLP